MAEEGRGTFVWGAWVTCYAGLALAGVYLGGAGMVEGGSAAVAGIFCYSWAFLGGVTWHGKMRRAAAPAALVLAALGVAGVWLAISFTEEPVGVAAGVVRILATAVLLGSGIVLGETAGRRWSYALAFGLNGMAYALTYVALDMLDVAGNAPALRVLGVPGVFLAPLLQPIGGEVLSAAFWGAAAALSAVLRAYPNNRLRVR